MSATFSQFFQVAKLFNDQDSTEKQLQDLIESGLIPDFLNAVKSGKPINREAVRKALGLEPLIVTFNVVVDYNLSLAEMISARRYDWVNGDITAEHFPAQGEGKQELELALFHFNRYISSDEAIEKMEQAGFRPAFLPELLALGAQYPELQRQFPIVALGSVWRARFGLRSVPDLWRDGAERFLRLSWFGDAWYPDYRFAAVRK